MAARMTNLILHSLAARYAAVLENATSITGKTLKRLYIVGGGSKNAVLNRLTEKATGLQVLTGSTESATVGNFAIQLAAMDGNYTPDDWSHRERRGRVGQHFVGAAGRCSEIEAPGNTLARHTVEEIQRPTGKALA